MAQWIRTIYEHRQKDLPFLVVIMSGVKSKKIQFVAAAKTHQEAEAILDQAWADLDAVSKAKHALQRRYSKTSAGHGQA